MLFMPCVYITLLCWMNYFTYRYDYRGWGWELLSYIIYLTKQMTVLEDIVERMSE